MLADVSAIIGSLDIVFGEIDFSQIAAAVIKAHAPEGIRCRTLQFRDDARARISSECVTLRRKSLGGTHGHVHLAS